MTHVRTPQDVLDFWFGTLDDEGQPTAEVAKRWFSKDDAFDQQVRTEFGATFDALVRGDLDGWRDTLDGTLATIIVVDQFARNMFRDTAQMYAHDAIALDAACALVDDGRDVELKGAQRTFAYMPFMHSEDLAHQERCIALFQAFAEACEGDNRDRVLRNVDYAVRHRDIVEQWGRFPHRNAILGRVSTDDEVAFLKTPGSGF